MYGDIKVGKCTLRIWWYIFFALQLSLIALMIGTFGARTWARTDIKHLHISKEDTNLADSTSYYDGYFEGKFEGSISICKHGCDKTYLEEANDWCTIYNDLDAESLFYEGSEEYNNSKSLCIMFYSLYAGASSFFVFEISSMIAIIVWFSTMMCFLRRINCFWMTYCCSICGCVCHYIGILLWFGFTGSNFNNKCDEFPPDGKRPEMCAADGPGLAVFVMIIFPIIAIFYIVIGCIAYPKRNRPEYQNVQGVQGVQMIPVQQIPMYVNNGPGYGQPYQPAALIIQPPPGQGYDPTNQGQFVNDPNAAYNNPANPPGCQPQSYPPSYNPNPQPSNSSSAYPPSAYPPSAYPPSAYPPSAYPPPPAYPPMEPPHK